MESMNSNTPFALVSSSSQSFGNRVKCVLNLPCLSRAGRITGFAIEGTGAMDSYHGVGAFGLNQVQPVATSIAELLAELDDGDGTSGIYWGTGDPELIQPLGFRRSGQWQPHRFFRPTARGRAHTLLPALKYFVDGFDFRNRPVESHVAATQGFYVFAMWDGLDDFDAVVEYCRGVVNDINSGKRIGTKLVFVGVGADIATRTHGQMQALAALSGRTIDPPIRSVIASEYAQVGMLLRNCLWESITVAKTGAVLDDEHRDIRRFRSGVPGAFEFVLPSRSRVFWLEIDGRLVRGDLNML